MVKSGDSVTIRSFGTVKSADAAKYKGETFTVESVYGSYITVKELDSYQSGIWLTDLVNEGEKMSLPKEGTKVIVTKWDGHTGANGDPTGVIGYVYSGGVHERPDGSGKYYCLIGEGSSEFEVVKENNMSGKLTMDMVKSGDVIMIARGGGIQKRLVIDINGKLQQVGRSGWSGLVVVESVVELYRGSGSYDVKRAMFDGKEPDTHMELIWKKEDEAKEFSMQEIADKMGVSVESLRIKE